MISSTVINRRQLADLILARLEELTPTLHAEFHLSRQDVGVRYCIIDDLFPVEVAERISRAFPKPDSMRLMKSFREKKYTSKNFDEFDPLMAEITFAFQDPRVVHSIERITGISEQMPDSSLYAGGLSAMAKGHHLGPHLDNSHDASRRYYRTLNLLYYITPNWSLENGGNLELWDSKVRSNVTIVSRFNRLAIMETTPTSWHSVSEVRVNGIRNCVSNYYFSHCSPTGRDYLNVTSFSARPDQPVRRLLARIDNSLRQALRKVAPTGFGKEDLYEGPK